MKVTVDSKKGLKTKLKVFVDKKTIKDRVGERLNEMNAPNDDFIKSAKWLRPGN